MSDLDEERMKAEIQRRSKRQISPLLCPRWESSTSWSRQKSKGALPQDGFLGADIVFGGHPHVVEPAEVVNKDGSKQAHHLLNGEFPF